MLHCAIIGCVKALMNSPVSTKNILSCTYCLFTLPLPIQDGRAHVLVHPNAIAIIAQSLKTSITRTKILGLNLSLNITNVLVFELLFTSVGDHWGLVPSAWWT